MHLALWLHLPVSLHKRDTLSLVREREERREHIARTPPHCCCAALCHSHLGSCAHKNRESRPPKPAPFASSSARVKNGNQVFGERLHATARSFVLLPATSRRLGVIDTATLLHGIERDDYIDNRYVN